MGNCCRLPIRFRRTSSAMNPKSVTLLLVGLDNSGKTTIAKRLAGEPVDSAVSTVGFSVILLREKGCHVSLYDLGGGPQIRDIWPRYYADAHGVVFVADAHDLERIDECRQVLQSVLESELISGKPVLLLANKQDLDGALDEIDIVDRLNLERVVNEQKCPTLVELCSALHFSRKMDIGINNGYKWLIRSIIRDYPSLNNRVIKDLARQEEQNKVRDIRRQMERDRRREEEEAIKSFADGNPFIDPFKPIKRILDEKMQPNGVTKSGTGSNRPGRKPTATVPGFIDEVPDKLRERKAQIQRVLGEEIVSVPEEKPKRQNSEVFMMDQFESDVQLLNEVPNQKSKNFLVRPKSSGARLYGVRSEKIKIQRRKPLKKSNKTGPSPFTDISSDQNTGHRAGDSRQVFGSSKTENQVSTSSHEENENPFVVTNGSKDRQNMAEPCSEISYLRNSKSMPNSRKNSLSNGTAKRRRNSLMMGKLEEDFSSKTGKLPPIKGTNRKEILLDVSNLGK